MLTSVDTFSPPMYTSFQKIPCTSPQKKNALKPLQVGEVAVPGVAERVEALSTTVAVAKAGRAWLEQAKTARPIARRNGAAYYFDTGQRCRCSTTPCEGLSWGGGGV